MSKKTALDLACEDICYDEGNELTCPPSNGLREGCYYFKPGGFCGAHEEKCAECWKKYYKQQADISDGGEVIKFMYDQLTKYQSCCKKRAELHPNKQVKHEVSIEVCILDKVLEMMKYHLMFAGIEDKNEQGKENTLNQIAHLLRANGYMMIDNEFLSYVHEIKTAAQSIRQRCSCDDSNLVGDIIYCCDQIIERSENERPGSDL